MARVRTLQHARRGLAQGEKSLLGDWFTWWLRQLRDLLPERWRGRGGPGANGVVLDVTQPGHAAVLRRRRGVDTRLGQGRTDDQGGTKLRALLTHHARNEKVILRIPPGAALERLVSLPLAAERDPERVLGYEMERLTPFTPAEVFWAWSLVMRDRVRGRLNIRLTLVPRVAVLQTLSDLAAGLGARPDMLEAQAPDGGWRTILVAHAALPGRGRIIVRRAALGLAGVCVLALLLAPFVRQQIALAAVADQLSVLQPRIAQVETLRRRIARAGAGQDAVAAEMRQVGDTLLALAALTEILPDDTHLTEFTMRERKMTLNGLSASAPRLISLLSDDPRIRNPAFTAPVTRAEATHDDVFSMRAELAP